MEYTDIQRWYNKYEGIPWEMYGFSQNGLDCYNLIRWVILQETGHFIEHDTKFHTNGISDNTWPDQFLERGASPLDLMDTFGWVKINSGPLRPFDMITFQLLKCPVANHAAIYVGSGLMLNTSLKKKSHLAKYEPFGFWYNKKRGVFRWKDLI